MEDWSYQEINFLDYKLRITNGNIQMQMQNKNEEKGFKLVQFIPAKDMSSDTVKKGMIIGLFKKCARSCNTMWGGVLSILKHIKELLHLGYHIKQLRNILRKIAREPIARLCIHLLGFGSIGGCFRCSRGEFPIEK